MSTSSGNEPQSMYDQRQQHVDHQINVAGNAYIGRPTQNESEALAIYRRVYIATYRQLALHDIDINTSDTASALPLLNLEQFYITLDTTKYVEQAKTQADERRTSGEMLLVQEQETPLSLIAAAAQHRHQVILGAPGSGKSTFLNYLGLCLALQGNDPEGEWRQRLPQWPQAESMLPVTIILRDFASTIADTTQSATPLLLWEFIAERLRLQNMSFVTDFLSTALENGNAIILLDGLDEIPWGNRRTFVRNCVRAFADRYAATRMLITCRTLSYQDPNLQLNEMPNVEIARFDEDKIHTFIRSWYDSLARLNVVEQENSAHLAHLLQRAVAQPELDGLANNPLLLTVMALVHTHHGQLPNARALLYEKTVDILLWRWEDVKLTRNREINGETETTNYTLRQRLREANLSDVDLKFVLSQLAYQVHKQESVDGADERVGGLAKIDEFTLQKALSSLHPEQDRNWAYNIIQAIKLRAGLLLEEPAEHYTFPHRSFQEYLAGCYLATRVEYTAQAAELANSGLNWHQVILWSVGYLVHIQNDIDKPLVLISELCPDAKPDINSTKEWHSIGLAGQCLAEIGIDKVKQRNLGRMLLGQVHKYLAILIKHEILSLRERVEYGSVLSVLSDYQDIDILLQLGRLYQLTGLPNEAQAQFEQALESAEQSDDLAAQGNCQIELGKLYRERSQYNQADSWFNDAQKSFEQSGDEIGLALTYKNRGTLAALQNHNEVAQEYYNKSLRVYETLQDESNMANVLNNLGILARRSGDLETAKQTFLRSIEIGRDRYSLSSYYNNLGLVYYDLGENEAAIEALTKVRESQEEEGRPWNIANVLNNLGNVNRTLGHYDVAEEMYTEALRQKLEDENAIASLLEDMAALAALQKHPERAFILWGAATAVRDKNNSARADLGKARVEHILEEAREEFGNDFYSAAMSEGSKIGDNLHKAVEYALQD